MILGEKLRKHASTLSGSGATRALDLARVLLVHGELAPRLTLQKLLQAGGYSVDVAATPAEALASSPAATEVVAVLRNPRRVCFMDVMPLVMG